MPMRLLRNLFLVLPLIAVACQGETDPKHAKTIEVGKIARDIQRSPTRAKSIIEDAGYTEESYRKAIFEIAQDPEQNAVYMKVLKGETP